MVEAGQCTKCGVEPRQGTHRWGKACLKAYRAERKQQRRAGDRERVEGQPEAGDLGVGERPAEPAPSRERRDPKSAGRVAHEQGAGAGPVVRRCSRHGKRVWVEGLVKQALDCEDPRCREEAG